MNGKGSRRRPSQISREEEARRWSAGDHSKYADGWALAFGKKDKVKEICYNQPNPVEPEICIAELTTDERPISDI